MILWIVTRVSARDYTVFKHRPLRSGSLDSLSQFIENRFSMQLKFSHTYERRRRKIESKSTKINLKRNIIIQQFFKTFIVVPKSYLKNWQFLASIPIYLKTSQLFLVAFSIQILPNFMAFSEYMNFTYVHDLTLMQFIWYVTEFLIFLGWPRLLYPSQSYPSYPILVMKIIWP